jgi:hypothetical protein
MTGIARKTLIEMEMPVVWSHVRAIRQRIAESLADHPVGVVEAAQMVASELVENAVKYGDSVPACEKVRVTVSLEGNDVVIAVSNGIQNQRRVAALRERIERVNEMSADTLFMNRIEHILMHPSEHGELGLYRIGSEGRFHLEIIEENQAVTIVARRSMA